MWDHDKVKSLIEDYKENKILWDVRDPSYKDNGRKAKVWLELSRKYNCTTADLKEKIKNLRTTFHRNLKRNGNKRDPWLFFDSFMFLKDFDAPQRSIAQLMKRTEPSKVRADQSESPVSKRKKKKKNLAEVTAPAQEDLRDEAHEILTSSSKQDDFSVYGQHVGNELRKLSWTAYHVAKHYINNVLFEAAMGKFDQHDFVSSHYSDSSSSSNASTRAASPAPSGSSE